VPVHLPMVVASGCLHPRTIAKRDLPSFDAFPNEAQPVEISAFGLGSSKVWLSAAEPRPSVVSLGMVVKRSMWWA